MSDTFSRVKEIIVKQLKCPEDVVKPDALIQDDVGADSIDRVELMMLFEQEFGVEIPENKSYGFKTINDLVGFVDGISSDDKNA